MYMRSVWYEEVDKALHKFISENVMYKDEKGVPKYVTPCFSLDEEDISKMPLPTVMIRSVGETFDLYRYEPSPIQLRTTDEGTSVLEDSAKPYTLHYQLDFMARYKEDINDLLRTWLNKVPKRFLLNVIDMEGKERNCYMVQVGRSVTMNQRHGENTLYRSILKYDIKVEIDEGSAYEVKIASSVNLDFK